MPQPLRMRRCKSCLRAQHAFASRSLLSQGDQCPARRLHEQLQQRRCMPHTSAACQSILRSGCEPQRCVDGASNEEEDVAPYAWCAPGLQASLLPCMCDGRQPSTGALACLLIATRQLGIGIKPHLGRPRTTGMVCAALARGVASLTGVPMHRWNPDMSAAPGSNGFGCRSRWWCRSVVQWIPVTSRGTPVLLVS